MGVWKSVIIRRARLQKLSACIAHRQRVFILNRAWSRIVWAAGEREAARARKVSSGLSFLESGVLTDGVGLPRAIWALKGKYSMIWSMEYVVLLF